MFREVCDELGGAGFRSERPLSSKSLILAILPRTGSQALCSLLAQTGVLGNPKEYLNPRGPLQHWLRRYPAAGLGQYLEALRREQATANGLFAIKIAFTDLEPLLRSERLSALLGATSFVYLTRQDLTAQAISEYVAMETGVWHRERDGRVRGGGGGNPIHPTTRTES